MKKNSITYKQAVCIMVMFTLGTSLMYNGSKVKQDTWIALFAAAFLFVPLMLMFARITHLYPGKNLYEILIEVFGKFFGKALTALYTLYAIHIGAMLMRFYSEFIQVMSLPETPQLIVLVFLFALGIYMVKSGAQTLGRWAKPALISVITSVIITVLISIRFINLNYIKPIAATPFPKLFGSSFGILSISFGDTILFLALFGAVKPEKSPYRIFTSVLLFSLPVMLVALLRNTFVLGFPSLEMYFFPSYTTVSVISIGEFFTRIEVLIGIAFLLDLFVKLCVCMFAASIGTARLFNLDVYKKIVVPVTLLMLTLAGILYENTLEMYLWFDIYKYYAIPFQLIFPACPFYRCGDQNARKEEIHP